MMKDNKYEVKKHKFNLKKLPMFINLSLGWSGFSNFKFNMIFIIQHEFDLLWAILDINGIKLS